jgi:co-chaperonin GroES (HSP10)
MKGGIDYFILNIDRSVENMLKHPDGRIIYGHDGKPLYFENTFDPIKHVNREATIVGCPISLSEKFNEFKALNVGDEILVHQNVVNADCEIKIDGKIYYYCRPDLLLAKRNGTELQPLNNRVFLEKVENKQTSDLIELPFADKFVKQLGKVKWASDNAKKWGCETGDTVLLHENAFAEITIDEIPYYVVNQTMIYGKIVDGEIEPFGYFMLVKQNPEKESLIFIPEKAKATTLTGQVQKVGNQVNYYEPSMDIMYMRIAYQSFGDCILMRDEHAVGELT